MEGGSWASFVRPRRDEVGVTRDRISPMNDSPVNLSSRCRSFSTLSLCFHSCSGHWDGLSLFMIFRPIFLLCMSILITEITIFITSMLLVGLK